MNSMNVNALLIPSDFHGPMLRILGSIWKPPQESIPNEGGVGAVG